MSDNAKTVQAIYEAFGRGDVPFILEQLAPDVAWEQWDDYTPQKAGASHLMPRTGPTEVVEFFHVLSKWTFHEFDVRLILDGGDNVAGEVVFEATLDNGKTLRDEEMHLWSFNDDGKVTRFRHYCDSAKHIAAAVG